LPEIADLGKNDLTQLTLLRFVGVVKGINPKLCKSAWRACPCVLEGFMFFECFN